MKIYFANPDAQHLPPGHRFPMGKYELLRQRLATQLPQLQLTLADAATDGELALVHTPDYIQAVTNGQLEAAAQREIGFPWSPGMVERARRSVGATIMAARVAMAQGIAANLAGGTHHAYAHKGGGFCVFNDAAVATRLLQAEAMRQRQALRVAIVDLDVHQGNGTAHLFQGDDSVFTLSLHGAKNFPFRKETSDCDIELPDGCGDEQYLDALTHALSLLEQQFQPHLIIYLAGADPHEGDRLGRLKLSYSGLQARDQMVVDWAWQRATPLVMAMAGGYGVDIATTVQVQVHTFEVALAHWQRWQNQTL